jgi:cell wall assembly regulator SMI1
MPARDVHDLYLSLENWLREHSQPMYARLQDPVSPGDLAALEGVLGRRLPDDLRAALQIHDGGPSLDSYRLISAERIQLRYQDEMENVDQPSPVPGDGSCRPVAWSAGWIPFAEDGGLNFLCTDLDPDEQGTAGQVLRWERSSLGAHVAHQGLYSPPWGSFADWLGSMLDACLTGEVDIDAEGFIFLK